jgi:hypothetical protein
MRYLGATPASIAGRDGPPSEAASGSMATWKKDPARSRVTRYLTIVVLDAVLDLSGKEIRRSNYLSFK